MKLSFGTAIVLAGFALACGKGSASSKPTDKNCPELEHDDVPEMENLINAAIDAGFRLTDARGTVHAIEPITNACVGVWGWMFDSQPGNLPLAGARAELSSTEISSVLEVQVWRFATPELAKNAVAFIETSKHPSYEIALKGLHEFWIAQAHVYFFHLRGIGFTEECQRFKQVLRNVRQDAERSSTIGMCQE